MILKCNYVDDSHELSTFIFSEKKKDNTLIKFFFLSADPSVTYT